MVIHASKTYQNEFHVSNMTERYIESLYTVREERFESTLRPLSFSDFIGQEKAKEQIEIMIQAAHQRGESLGHCLLSGPPGLGKTTLSHIIAHAMGSDMVITSGPALEKPADLVAELTKLKARDVLFIDEIHRMPRIVEEYLYSAMEDFVIDIPQRARLPLERFTLIGATTRPGLLSLPFRSRFMLNIRLDLYEEKALQKILHRSSSLLQFPSDDETLFEIARRSRGTPRVANKLLRWVRDYSAIRAGGKVTPRIAHDALTMISIDSMGLDDLDFRILTTIYDKFNSGPVGIQTIAHSIMEEQETIEEVHEPFLIGAGLIKKTAKGRELTERGKEHILRRRMLEESQKEESLKR